MGGTEALLIPGASRARHSWLHLSAGCCFTRGGVMGKRGDGGGKRRWMLKDNGSEWDEVPPDINSS